LLSKLRIKITDDATFLRAKGCKECNNIGYRGRVAIMEAVEITEKLRSLILDEAPESEIRKKAHSTGMIPLREAALRKVLAGETTLEEMVRISGDELGFDTRS
jgi:type IV pilus assembly protein PilB